MYLLEIRRLSYLKLEAMKWVIENKLKMLFGHKKRLFKCLTNILSWYSIS